MKFNQQTLLFIVAVIAVMALMGFVISSAQDKPDVIIHTATPDLTPTATGIPAIPALPDALWECLGTGATVDNREVVHVAFADDGYYAGVPIIDWFLYLSYATGDIVDPREHGRYVHVRTAQLSGGRMVCTFPTINSPPILSP